MHYWHPIKENINIQQNLTHLDIFSYLYRWYLILYSQRINHYNVLSEFTHFLRIEDIRKKGQIISKGFLVSSISPKKWTKQFDFTTAIPHVDLFSFVFWERVHTGRICFNLFQISFSANTADVHPGPQGCQGCQEIRNLVRNSKILIARSTIQPKLSKIKNHLPFSDEFWCIS